MDHDLPEWLNDTFLEEALQQGEGKHDRVIVTKFTAKPAAAVGDNYTSHLIRVHITFKTGSSDEEDEMALIIKAPSASGVMHELDEKWNINDLEPSMYNDILPKMYQKLNIHFGPNSYHSSMRGALVLRDLKKDGFVVFDRFKQLDFEHCKLFYENLAKYHATSVVLHNEDPELVEKIGKETGFAEDAPFTDVFKPWTEASLKNFIELLREMDGDQVIIDFLQSKADTIWNSLIRLLEVKSNRLNVLNHGDCWTNNMMFKHNSEGEVVDIKLLDFQNPRYNSPIFDIIYFFWTSANENVRQNQQEEVFQVYVQVLNKTLEELGCEERLTLEQLEEDVKSAADFVIWVVSSVHVFLLCEPELALDFEKYTSKDFTSGAADENYRAIYNGKRYRAMVPGVIRDLQTWLISNVIIAQKP